MARSGDWGQVFGFEDPTPGEVSELRMLARRWSDVADEAEYAAARLRGLLGDGLTTTWIGQAGEAFRSRASELPDQLRKVEQSYRQACEALSWWAGRLESHQGAADAALVRGRAAKAELESALHGLGVADGQVGVASLAPVLAHPGGPGVVAPTREQVSAAMSRLESARASAARSQALVDDARARLDAARRLAAEAGELRVADGRVAAARIHEAAEAGIAPRSFWARAGESLASAWHVVVAVAKVVVAVLGVVALIIGGPIAWVVFAAALLVLADTLMKYSRGEASLREVGLALLSCIPGTKGLTTLGELSAAFKAGGMLGAGAHLLGAGKTAVVSLAQGVRALSSGLCTSMVVLGGRLRFTEVMALVESTAQGRVYAMWDGVDHVTQFAPEQLAALESARRQLGPALASHGWSMGDLIRTINTPTSDLSRVERATLTSLRDLVTIDAGTVMQKVIDAKTFESYVMGRMEGVPNFDPSSIRGFMTRAGDTSHLGTPQQIFDGLRLVYANTTFDAAAESYQVIRFRPEEGSFIVPRGPDLGGTVDLPKPFTGNGFTGALDVIPEVKADAVVMSEGTEIWDTADGGTQRLLAVLRGGQWVPGGLW